MRFSVGFVIVFFLQSVFAAGESSSTTPSYKASIDAKIYSQFIDRGLAISDGNPAMNVSFLYNLGAQFRVGFWGSNISNVSSTDDNFWFKFIADVRVDFSNTSGFILYIHDDHFYKSSIRNGQSLGLRLNYNAYLAELEWMNNYQGTRTNAEYINFGRLWDYKMFKIGGKGGYTIQSAEGYTNYFDLKALGQYMVATNSVLEAGATTVIGASEFSERAKTGFYVSISLSY